MPERQFSIKKEKHMAYDSDFYKQYRAYLRERSVRSAHDLVFAFVKRLPEFDNVVDLGCGQFNEFYHYARPRKYLGLDVNAVEHKGWKRTTRRGDYRDFRLV